MNLERLSVSTRSQNSSRSQSVGNVSLPAKNIPTAPQVPQIQRSRKNFGFNSKVPVKLAHERVQKIDENSMEHKRSFSKLPRLRPKPHRSGSSPNLITKINITAHVPASLKAE
jgi:hypothetical protein